VDLPISHCEQSWEGGKSDLVSPDTGLGRGSGNAAGGALRLVFQKPSSLLAVFLILFNVPTGTFGIIQEISHANQK
jgi:hypothetical protein